MTGRIFGVWRNLLLVMILALVFPAMADTAHLWNNPDYSAPGQRIWLYANISGINVSDIYVNITNPLQENESYPMELQGGNTYAYGYTIPEDNFAIGSYEYFVSLIQESIYEESVRRSFYALHPEVTVWSEPFAANLGESVGLYANLSGLNTSQIYINVTIPSGETFLEPMGSLGNSTYYYNLSIPFNESYYGTCPYYVKFLDAGYMFQSNESYFFVVWPHELLQNVTINIQVVPTCMVSIVRYIPFDVQRTYNQNVTLPMLVYFENTGNINITNKSFTLGIENSAGVNVWSASGEGYPDDPIDTGGNGFYWNIWSTGLSPFGSYTAIALVSYGSLINNQSINISVSALRGASNCTDDGVNLTCVSARSVSGSVYTMARYNLTANETSITTIPNMKNGTVAKYGIGAINGTNHRVFLFITETCDDYCYACLTLDLATEPTILAQGDCTFANTKPDNFGVYVESIGANGSFVEFGKRSIIGRSIRINYDCLLSGDNITAGCIMGVECNGTVERREPFEIVNITTIVPTPTPEPMPQPQPQPEPVPKPMPLPEPVPKPKTADIAVDIKPLNNSVSGEEGIWTAVIFNVTNIGNVNVTNITLVPIVPKDWEKKDALVSFLEVGKTVNRTIFVKPPYGAIGEFVIPVKATGTNVTLDIDYFWLEIAKGENRTRLEIIEIPRELNLPVSSESSLPILIKNTGHLPLSGIRLRIENGENCIESYNYTEISSLDPLNTTSMAISIRTKAVPGICNTTVIVWSNEGAYAFSPLTIFTTPGIMTPPIPLLPLLAFILIFIEIMLLRRKKKKVIKGEKCPYTDAMIILVFIAIVIVVSLTILEFLGYPPDKLLAQIKVL